MRIAVLSSHTPSLFWFRMSMMEMFRDMGHEVYAVANEPEAVWRDKFETKGIHYRQIYIERNGVNPLKDLKTLSSVKHVLREIKPDKLFTYQAKTVIYGGIAAHQLGITEVYPLIAGVGSVFLRNDFKTKLVRTVLVTEYRIGMKHSRAVFFQNPDDEQMFRDCRIIRRQPTALIHGSGVSTERFVPTPLPETPVFLCISRLIRDKGVYEYLEACRRLKQSHPHVRCLLVGPFDSNPSALKPDELQPFIDNGSVEYFGEQTDVRPFLAQCSVFVLVSYREGTPKTNLEAMACGRAVITTDTPGCRETVTDGENGWLVPVKDVNALYGKMVQCIEQPETVAEMGIKGRELAKRVFDVKPVNQRIAEIMNLTTQDARVTI